MKATKYVKPMKYVFLFNTIAFAFAGIATIPFVVPPVVFFLFSAFCCYFYRRTRKLGKIREYTFQKIELLNNDSTFDKTNYFLLTKNFDDSDWLVVDSKEIPLAFRDLLDFQTNYGLKTVLMSREEMSIKRQQSYKKMEELFK